MDASDVSAIVNENDLLLPDSHVKHWIYFIICFILGLSLLYLLTVEVVKRMNMFRGTKLSQKQEVSFVIVATVKNSFLVIVGLYYYLGVLPRISDSTLEERIAGYESLAILAAVQLAYNLYSVPLSWMLGEKPDMMIHHVAVLFVSTLSTFFTCGFRYHAPYFFGVVEMSTLPFAFMQVFKTIPEWIKRYPKTYSAIRIAFGIPFLMVRVVLWVPGVVDPLSMAFMVTRTSEYRILSFLAGVFFVSTVALTGLQLYWGALIVKALFKQGKKKSAGTKHARE